MRLGTWGIVPIWILIALPPDQRQVPAFDCCINSCGQKVQQRKVIWMNEFKKVTKPTGFFYILYLTQPIDLRRKAKCFKRHIPTQTPRPRKLCRFDLLKLRGEN